MAPVAKGGVVEVVKVPVVIGVVVRRLLAAVGFSGE